MRPTSRVDHAHAEPDPAPVELDVFRSRSIQGRTPIVWGSIVTIVAVSLGFLWLTRTATDANMSVVFPGRVFDKSTRRQALTQLERQGIEAKLGGRGELLVRPDRLVEAQTSLEKLGLKPSTLEELRETPGGALSILESPAQRDDRLRQTKEKELAWLLERLDEVADAVVAIEQGASANRWIGKREPSKVRVRVFVESDTSGCLSDDAVDRIEKVVIAGLPTTGPGLVTIHDARTIYRMAGQGGSTGTAGSENPAFEERELAVAAKIRGEVAGLAGASVRVALRQVEESRADAAAGPDLAPEEKSTRLYFNQSASVFVPPDPATAPRTKVRTERARVQILPDASTAEEVASAEAKRRLRDQIAAVLSPVLLEQVDWLTPPSTSVSSDEAKEPVIAAKAPEADSIRPKTAATVTKPTFTPIDESTRLRLGPWIMGGVALAFVGGGFVLWRTMQSDSQEIRPEVYDHQRSHVWARDLAAAVAEPHVAKGPHELPTDKAAAVLSSWIPETEEPDTPRSNS